jgi:hypothetical protein
MNMKRALAFLMAFIVVVVPGYAQGKVAQLRKAKTWTEVCVLYVPCSNKIKQGRKREAFIWVQRLVVNMRLADNTAEVSENAEAHSRGIEGCQAKFVADTPTKSPWADTSPERMRVVCSVSWDLDTSKYRDKKGQELLDYWWPAALGRNVQ